MDFALTSELRQYLGQTLLMLLKPNPQMGRHQLYVGRILRRTSEQALFALGNGE
jgi:hypothetical protein